jgi:hypothetical protein
MRVDVALITVGLYLAGGLGAAQYLGIYLIVTICAGITLSSSACLVATVAATASYAAIVTLQQSGILAMPAHELSNWCTRSCAGSVTGCWSRATAPRRWR